jgi:hypothetical protein
MASRLTPDTKTDIMFDKNEMYKLNETGEKG